MNIIHADVVEGLRQIPDHSVHCVVTSPPYWGLRTYAGVEPRKWEDGSECVFGLEPSLDLYIEHLVEVFRGLKRVLHPSGTFYLNIGDCYDHAGPQPSTGIHAKNGVPLPNTFKRANSGRSKKNLAMVPARAALALQSEYYYGQLKKESDRTWLAALVDGEGCITILHTHSEEYESFPSVLSIHMCDREMLDHTNTLINGGKINGPYPTQNGNRDCFKWRLTGKKSAGILAEIYPHLLIKRKQALIAWNLEQERATYTNQPRPAASREKQAFCRELIQKLNHHEPVDIPSWMKEPTSPKEPGWILRNDLIWAKGLSFCPSYSGSVMPESIRDRAVWAHEHLFHFSVNPRYFYDIDGCREAYADSTLSQTREAYLGEAQKNYEAAGAQNPSDVKRRVLASIPRGGGRNLRNVWVIGKEPLKEAHFAAFPTKLVEPVIRLGSSEHGCCPACYAPWERVTHREPVPTEVQEAFERARTRTTEDTGRVDGHTARKPNHRRRILGEGWRATCKCEAGDSIPTTVLDPFSGSGRAGVVAKRLGRNFIGIDASEEYCQMARRVINDAT